MRENDAQHRAFHKFGEEMGLDMRMHPLHLFYLSYETKEALIAFKAAWKASRQNTIDELRKRLEESE